MPDPIRTSTLEQPGGTTRVVHFAGKGPPLVALHGFTGRGEDFELLASSLERSVDAPDLSGHGPLATSDPIAMATECRRLVSVLDGLGAQQPVLLGYSLGGRTALSLAAAHPDRIGALVLIGASPGLAQPAEAAERRASDEELAGSILRSGVEAFCERWERHPVILSQARIPEPHGSALRSRRRSCKAEGLAASLRGVGTGAMPALWDRLPELDLPVLLLVGEDDLKFRGIADQMAALLPRAQVVAIPDAGHCCHLEQAAATAGALRAFLGSIEG